MPRSSRPLLALALAALLAAPALAQERADSIEARHEKTEAYVPMRDGVRLHTTVYAPRDTTRAWPILMKRTPYSCRPYGAEVYPPRIASEALEADGYVFVCQDVRGRWMSEGDYVNMRPHAPGERPVDESSDTYDTIEWLLANVPRNNGKVGIYGISYPGFYTAASLPEAHPALVAASPQAPIADFWFDDFHHRGAFTLSYLLAFPVFGHQTEPTSEAWYSLNPPETPDGYDFYMDLGPLSNADSLMGDDMLWAEVVEHPNYDAHWRAKSILPHLDDIHTATLTVGGWFDAEDLYGPLAIYRAIEHGNPGLFNALVMGPWSHGDWARDRDVQVVGDLAFGEGLSAFFQEEVEAPFFRRFLHGEGEGEVPDFEALVFDTGAKAWRRFEAWPPAPAEPARWWLADEERLAIAAPDGSGAPFTEYESDPHEPVPYTDRIRVVFTPRAYMTEDQRFAERRPDVIEFVTEPLAEDVTLAGPITAHLEVSTTGTDADWVVKLIDVLPDSTSDQEGITPPGQHLGGYQMMVRSEIMRGRFRESFEKPEPFVPGVPTTVEFPLQDVFHTFRAGHRIMVQVQSTWFPLFDRNPQTFVPNIYRATDDDFVEAVHRVYHAPGRASWIETPVLPAE